MPFPSSDVSRLFSRRGVLAASAALVAVGPARAAPPPTFRVGTLPFGTVQWEIKTITDNGFDKANGLAVENLPLASNDAARVAFLSGSVDAIVNDLLFAARLRSEGQKIRFMPFSTKEGALMVANASPIRSVGDLKGKKIGIAGGALDKSWLVLRAAAAKQGVDLTRDADPVFGAPPLLAAKLESGELDAGLLYWSYCARLQAKTFRQVVSVEDLVNSLGARGKIAFVGFLFKEATAESVLQGFSKAVRQADALLAEKPSSWDPLRPLMQVQDGKTFDMLKQAFVGGIPHKPRAAEIADASAFYATLAKLGGPALVGSSTTLPEGLYVSEQVYG